MKYIALVVLLLLSACTSTTADIISEGNINSGIPIYKKDNTIYYCEIKDDIYNIIQQTNERTVLTTLDLYKGATALFVDDKYLYYTSADLNSVSVYKQEIGGSSAEALFTHEPKVMLENDYIYVSNDTVYYFIPNDGLWKITDNGVEVTAEGAKDCVIVDNTIYYSKNGNIYSQSIGTDDRQTLITKDAIFASGQNDRLLLQTLGDGYVDNILICGNQLYFQVTDGYSGGIFCMDLDGENFSCVNPELRVYRFMFDQNGDMYLSGVDTHTQIKGLYKISDNTTLISEEAPADFYVNDGCYFYTTSSGGLSYIK